MTPLERFHAAYTEALYFTETGTDMDYSSDAELSPLTKSRCYCQCRDFFTAYRDLIPESAIEQAGHDLWLTRNGHGAGFWDRPELYGSALSDQLTRASKAMGEFHPEFSEE